MPYSTTVQNCLSARRLGATYAPPEPLEDLHILDLLELTGSQPKAGQALAMHQSTVCRSVQKLTEQFRLQPRPGARVCRYGSNESLHLLRLCYRAHRLMDGLLRIATDALHQPLLQGLARLQPVPPRFRSAAEWAELVAQALIDGAIVSSSCHEQAGAQDSPPRWDGVVTVPLGVLPLQLVSASTTTNRVLLPCRFVTPGLQQAIACHGLQVEPLPVACQELNAWIEHSRDRQLAMPLGLGLLQPDWLQSQDLELLAAQPPLLEQLWLLLPPGSVHQSREAQDLIGLLRQRVGRAGEQQLGNPEPTESQPAEAATALQAESARETSKNYAESA